MKKILSALALVSLAFGTASADPKLGLNVRTQMDAYQTDTLTNMNNYFAQQKKGGAYNGSNDNITFTAANDIVSIVWQFAPDNAKVSLGNKTLDSVKQFNGTLNLGKWEFFAGLSDGGKANSTYRLGGDAYDWDGKVFETYKLGTIYGGNGAFADNIFNAGKAQRVVATYLNYGDQIGKAKLMLTGSLFGSNWDTAGTQTLSGYAFKADVMWNNNWDHQFTFKSGKNTDAVLSYYVQPYFIPNTQLTVGGSAVISSEKIEQYGIDVRSRYVTGPLSISFLGNFSHTRTASEFGAHLGAYCVDAANSNQLSGIMGTGTSKGPTVAQEYIITSTYGLYTVIGAAYKINDTVRAYFSLGQQSGLDDYSKEGTELFVFPAVILTAKGNARISTGLRFGFSNLGIKDDAEDGIKDVKVYRSVEIPVIARIRL